MSQVNTSKITAVIDRLIKLEKNVIELNKLFASNNSLKNKVSELENKVQLLETPLAHISTIQSPQYNSN